MIDARGLSCPMPVVMVQVLVDARVAVENISRFARSKGYGIAVEEQGGDYKLTLTK